MGEDVTRAHGSLHGAMPFALPPHTVAGSSSVSDLLHFTLVVGLLKRQKRTGWIHHGVHLPESVADHSYRAAVLALVLPGAAAQGIDRDRCVKMALVHDLAESIVGDITPSCGVGTEEKHGRERVRGCGVWTHERQKALTYLGEVASRAGGCGAELLALWEEYEAGATAGAVTLMRVGDSCWTEARIVKDLDRLDMALQAFEYEQVQGRPGALEGFFQSVEGKIYYPALKAAAEELKALRAAMAAPGP